MKKEFVFAISLMLCSTASYCQLGNYTREKSISGIKTYAKNTNVLKYKRQILPEGAENSTIASFECEDQFAYNKALYEAFSKTRLTELSKNINKIFFTFYLTDEGKILEMNIKILDKKELSNEFSDKELSSLEKAIRTYVKLTAEYNFKKGANYILYVQPLSLDRVLANQPLHDQ